MPSHKRSWSDSVHGEEPIEHQQFSHQDAKQSRTEREPKIEMKYEEEEEEEEKEEEEEEEQHQKQLKEGEELEEDEGEEEKQLEEATGARGYVTCINLSFFFDFVRFVVLVPILRFWLWFLIVCRLLKLFLCGVFRFRRKRIL